MITESFISEIDIAAANRKHDMEHGDPYKYSQARIKPSWKSETAIRGRKLSGKEINKYEKKGRYSDQYKEALRALMFYKKTGKLPKSKEDKIIFRYERDNTKTKKRL